MSSETINPPQHQDHQPGDQHAMHPEPIAIPDTYCGSGKLEGKAAIITGGDSGIGRSVACYFAREGADVAIVYLEEDRDAEKTKQLVEKEGRQCLLIRGDVGEKSFCDSAVKQAVDKFGRLDILINNAAEQHPTKEFLDITEDQLVKTFRTNIFGYFFMAQAALPHLRKKKGSSIVNTTSVTSYRGSPTLVDYSATKGAITAFTRALSSNLAKMGEDKDANDEGHPIRVNGVAPGPIWTPLIPATFPKDKVESFGGDTPMGRPGQPHECAAAYVFLASNDASYITGQVIHPNGGELIGG